MSADGTEIAGRVQGHGPPVVFVNGGAGDGDTSWGLLMPFVAEHFTCFLLSTRGRGLSADSDDHSCERLVEDVTAFADSIGEPVGLVGHSSGAMLGLAAAAARSAAVSAVVAYEPAVAALLEESDLQQLELAVGRAHEAAVQGQLADAARRFVEACPFFNDEESALLSDVGAFEFMAPFVLMWMQEQSEYLRAIDPAVIERISAPVLLLHGPHTHRVFTASVRHLADEIADARLTEIPDVGHMGPVVAPAAVADELVRFLEDTLAPA